MIKNTKHNEFKKKHFCPAQKLDLPDKKEVAKRNELNYFELSKAVKEA